MSAAPATRVVMVGAGLSGLVSAREALVTARARGTALDLTVLDASPHAGGNLRTERHDGFLIDIGPDSWVAAKPEGTDLCRALALGDQLIETLPQHRRVYVAHHGRLVRMPEGLVLGVPTKLDTVLRSPLLSYTARARLLADLVLPAMPPFVGDVSLGELVARRLGREAVAALVEPLLAGIYAGDAWSLSAQATFPQLVAMAAHDRSLLRAARLAAPQRHGGTVPPSAFVSLRHGVGSLIDALVDSLPKPSLRLSTPALALRRGTRSPWELALPSGEALPADHVVLGMAPRAAAMLVADSVPTLSEALSAIPCTSTATVFFAWRRADITHPLDATGFVVPKREGMRILAATWVTSKWEGRAPDGYVLMRAFLGGVGREATLARNDDELITEARVDIERLMRHRAPPLFTRVFRFIDRSPLPLVGHADRVARVRAAEAEARGLHCIGSAYDGVGISDTVRLATDVGRRIAGATP